jgi:hypothetical protein
MAEVKKVKIKRLHTCPKESLNYIRILLYLVSHLQVLNIVAKLLGRRRSQY